MNNKENNKSSSVVPTRWNQKLAENLQKRMSEFGFNSVQLSKLIGVDDGTVRNWLKGLNTPKGDSAVLLSEVLECSMDWLFKDEGPEPGPPGQKTDPTKPRPIYKVADRPDRVAAPEREYDPHGGWKPQTDPEDWAMLNKAHAVLTSDTLYSTALAANINAFHRAMMADKKINELENISKIQSDKIIALEKRIDDLEKKSDNKKCASL